MFMEILKLLLILIAIDAYNARPERVSPRYWRTLDIDSLTRVAGHKTDSTLGVYVYTDQLEQLKKEFE
jgi:hypothetical protein